MVFNRRKLRFINPQIQKWLLLVIAGGIFICTVTSITVSNLFFEMTKSSVIEKGIDKNSVMISFLSSQQYKLTLVLFCFGILTMIFLLIYGYFLSHKIVGPIYRIQETLKSYNVANGPIKIKIRDSDFFQDLPPLISKIVNGDLND